MATDHGSIDRDALLEELRRLEAECGTLPSMDDVVEKADYPLEAYVETFGSYPEAVQAAGLKSDVFTRSSRTSNEQLIDDLRDFADEIGHRPSQAEMNEDGPHSVGRYAHRFESWTNALERAGFEPWQPERTSDQVLLDAIHDLADEIGDVPRATQMDERGEFSSVTYYKRFGGWGDALEAADLDAQASRTKLSEADIVEAIQELGEELGRAPTMNEMDEQGEVSSVVAHNRFGSWSEALDRAGFDVDDEDD